jgi:hypothetical protein
MTGELSLLRIEADLRPLLLEAEPQAISAAISGWLESGLVVRVVRGRKMRSRRGVFDEFAAALQFPLYFGENEDAFDECISELEQLPRQSGFVVVVTEPGQVLVDDGEGALTWLVGSLRRAVATWSRPIEVGEWWDRAAYPFHVVLACEPGEGVGVSRHWAAAEATAIPFPTTPPP